MMESNSSKRSCIPEGDTPNKPTEKRARSRPRSSSFRKSLFPTPNNVTSPRSHFLTVRKGPLPVKSPVKIHNWSVDEDRALLEFIGVARTDPSYEFDFDSAPSEWPSFREKHKFWSDGANHIKTTTRSNFLLSSSRVRSRVTNKLRRTYKSLNEAEEAFHLTISSILGMEVESVSIGSRRTSTDKATQTDNVCAVNDSDNILQNISRPVLLAPDDQIHHDQMNNDFLQLAEKKGIKSKPSNFVSLAITAMEMLEKKGKPNLLYKFAYCLGTNQPDSDQPLFDVDRMPFGLVQYQIEFFSCTNIVQIQMPYDYQMWHETMCSEFPTRFNRLFRGPMWSGIEKQFVSDPLYARPNVAAPSTRTIQKKAHSSTFTVEPVLQREALNQLKVSNPNGRFWIKLDGFDINEALQESVMGVWNGDIDLGDGKVEALRMEYEKRRNLCNPKDLKEDRLFVEKRLIQQVENFELDIKFLADGLIVAESNYQKKFSAPNTSENTLKTLCWERVEFSSLLSQAQNLKEKHEVMICSLDPSSPRVKDVIKAVRNLEKYMLTYLQNIFKKKRQPAATHVLLFLISDERRNKKPFAMPVQYIPYKSIRDQFVRDLTDKIKQEMVKMELKPVGKSNNQITC